MSDKALILAVDDEPINLEVLEEILEDNYQFEYVESGEHCLKKLQTFRPDIILLDVNMPGMSGIEVCKKIKTESGSSDIPIIFVSALGLSAVRMEGYNAGAEDYITKPFDENELLAKIELTLAVQQEKKALQQSSNDAMSMAMTAMTQASEIGEVMQFTRDSYHCNTLDALARRLLETLSQFDLNASIRMTRDKQDFFFSASGDVGENEQNGMEYVRESGRFIHLSKQTIINFDHISVLIKNMPVEDEAKYGRLNDVTGMLVEGADARLVGIAMSSSLLNLISTTREVLADIEAHHKINGQKNTAILDELVSRVEWSFINMDLSEQQEDYFRELLHHATEQSTALFDADTKMDKKIENLIDSLSIN